MERGRSPPAIGTRKHLTTPVAVRAHRSSKLMAAPRRRDSDSPPVAHAGEDDRGAACRDPPSNREAWQPAEEASGPVDRSHRGARIATRGRQVIGG